MARRRRDRPDSDHVVNHTLTSAGRTEYLDAHERSRKGDPIIERLLGAAARLAAGFRDQSPPLPFVAIAQEASAAADGALQAAVDRARSNGHSWREIGEMLGTTRQAAFQRFGHPTDPRTGVPMPSELPAGAADRAIALFAWHREREWERILAELNDDMRGRLDVTRMERGWARMAAMFGRLERIGKPFGRVLGAEVLVEVPLYFEVGEARGVVQFAADGKVGGLAIRPAIPPAPPAGSAR